MTLLRLFMNKARGFKEQNDTVRWSVKQRRIELVEYEVIFEVFMVNWPSVKLLSSTKLWLIAISQRARYLNGSTATYDICKR